jgi:hypothetical protein
MAWTRAGSLLLLLLLLLVIDATFIILVNK